MNESETQTWRACEACEGLFGELFDVFECNACKCIVFPACFCLRACVCFHTTPYICARLLACARAHTCMHMLALALRAHASARECVFFRACVTPVYVVATLWPILRAADGWSLSVALLISMLVLSAGSTP